MVTTICMEPILTKIKERNRLMHGYKILHGGDQHQWQFWLTETTHVWLNVFYQGPHQRKWKCLKRENIFWIFWDRMINVIQSECASIWHCYKGSSHPSFGVLENQGQRGREFRLACHHNYHHHLIPFTSPSSLPPVFGQHGLHSEQESKRPRTTPTIWRGSAAKAGVRGECE